MARPKHPNYDTAYDALGTALREAKEAFDNGTIGTVTDRLYDAVIALDDVMAHDGQESRFTRARPLLEVWKRASGGGD
jgi:hypothetical protein